MPSSMAMRAGPILGCRFSLTQSVLVPYSVIPFSLLDFDDVLPHVCNLGVIIADFADGLVAVPGVESVHQIGEPVEVPPRLVEGWQG